MQDTAPVEAGQRATGARLQSGTVGWPLLFCVLMAYLLTAPGHLQTIDMGSELAVARSIVDHLSFSVPHSLGVHGLHGGRFSHHAIGESFLLLPVVIIGELAPRADMDTVMAFAASMLTAAVAACGVLILYLFALDLGARIRVAAVVALVFAFGTMQWSYAHDAFDMMPTAFCLLLALFAAHRMRLRWSRDWLIVSGTAFAGAVLLRVPSLALWPAYGLYTYWIWPAPARLRALSVWSVPTLGALAVTGWYDWVRFGNPLQSGYGIDGDNGFSYPLWRGLAGLLASPGKSVFLYSPVLVLALLGLPWFLRRDRALAVTVLLVTLVTLVFYGRFNDWSGDWAWGPRFLLPLVPILLLPLVGVAEAYTAWGWLTRAGSGVLVATSIAVQFLSVLVDYQVQMELALYNGTLSLMYWTPRYSQLAIQAGAFWQVLHGAAVYPAVRVPHTGVLRPVHPISWDIWWITAWHVTAHRVILLVVLAGAVSATALSAACLARSLARASGAPVCATMTGGG